MRRITRSCERSIQSSMQLPATKKKKSHSVSASLRKPNKSGTKTNNKRTPKTISKEATFASSKDCPNKSKKPPPDQGMCKVCKSPEAGKLHKKINEYEIIKQTENYTLSLGTNMFNNRLFNLQVKPEKGFKPRNAKNHFIIGNVIAGNGIFIYNKKERPISKEKQSQFYILPNSSYGFRNTSTTSVLEIFLMEEDLE